MNDFRLGAVFADAWHILRGNPKPFAIIFAVASIINIVVMVAFEQSEEIMRGGGSAFPGGWGYYAFGLLLLAYGSALTGVACATTASETLAGRTPTASGILASRLPSLLPAIDATVICWILIALGAMAFIVPGIILAIMFWVVVPVVAIERAGVFAAMRRSRDLTRGRRWILFRLSLGIGVATELIPMLIYALLGPEAGIALLVLDVVLVPITLVTLGLFQAVCYFHLRAANETTDA